MIGFGINWVKENTEVDFTASFWLVCTSVREF